MKGKITKIPVIELPVKVVETHKNSPDYGMGYWMLEVVGTKFPIMLLASGQMYFNVDHEIGHIDPRSLGLNPMDLQ